MISANAKEAKGLRVGCRQQFTGCSCLYLEAVWLACTAVHTASRYNGEKEAGPHRLNIADDGPLRHLSNRLDVANCQGSPLACVDELQGTQLSNCWTAPDRLWQNCWE